MSNKRQRMTWAADKREAAAPPATPGYDVEDQDHPAYNPDPGPHDYENGDTSSWAEDPHPGPYGDSGAPALPGYGVEDQDHPAHQGQIGRQAGSYIKRKSAKCVRIARKMLGSEAPQTMIEDQALDMMDWSDDALDATMERLGGGLFADEDDFEEIFEEDYVMAEDDDDDGDDDDGVDAASHGQHKGGPRGGPGSYVSRGFVPGHSKNRKQYNKDYYALFGPKGVAKSAEEGLRARWANQNDPDDETLGADGEDEEKNKVASGPVLAMFDAYDFDGDGFISEHEWTGPRSLFASLDTDRDGIIARADLVVCKKADDDEDDADHEEPDGDEDGEDIDDDGDGKEGGKSAGCEKLPAGPMRDNCEKKRDEGDDKSDKQASFGYYADFDDDELEMLNSMQFDLEGDPSDLLADVEEELVPESEGDLETMAGANEYGEFFATDHDPMGLTDGTVLTAEDEAAFESVFGKFASDDEDDDDDDEGNDGEEASKKASFWPQPRKRHVGPKTLGSMSRTASRSSEIDDLSKLWATKPDVSGAFS